MSNRIPKDMLDRIPKNLFVRKFINIMMGIARNKIIWNNPEYQI